MHKQLQRVIKKWYQTISRRIFIKLLLLLLIPNLLLVLFINQILERKSEQKMEEINSTLRVLEHAVNREISALFNNFTTITNQILIEAEIQRILMENWQEQNLQIPNQGEREELNQLESFSDKQRIITNTLSRYRLVWNNIYSIAIVDTDQKVYLSTAQNYSVNKKDIDNSILLKNASSKDHSGLSWSVNDSFTKKEDMITIVRKIYGSRMPENIIGYVIINLSLEPIRNSFETYNYFGPMIFGLINETQNTWMYYDNTKIMGGEGQLLEAPISSYSNDLQNIPFKEKEWRTAISEIEKQGMSPMENYLFVGLDTSYIKAQVSQFQSNLYYGYALFFAFSMLISIQGTRFLAIRIGEILKAMRNFGKEKWGTRIHVKGLDEISIMGETFNYMASRIEQLLTNLKEQQKLKQTFELRVLEYQINPHFLYNTLDTINWLAIENNQPKISEMVNGLSKLFRIILSKGRETVSLQEEFEMINIYLEIHKIRFEDRFDFLILLDPQIAHYPIGKLILQPLVENAIIHGIRRLRIKGLIKVTGTLSADRQSVVLEISDNGVGLSSEQIKKQMDLLNKDVLEEKNLNQASYGMKNVDSRMKLLFGNDYRMTIESQTENGRTGTNVIIKIQLNALKNLM
jgi:two-component system, sensor histidine kinase YesM